MSDLLEVSGANKSSKMAEEPITNGLKAESEALTQPYSEVVDALRDSANGEPQELLPVIKSERGRKHFVPSTDMARKVRVLFPVTNNNDSVINLKRTSKSDSEGATIPLSAIGRVFGDAVKTIPGGTQVQIVLAGSGKSLIGYVLRGKSVRVYVPKPYCPVSIPQLSFAQPVRVAKLIIG